MTTRALLNQLYRERRQALDAPRYVSVSKCSAFIRRAYRDLQRGQKLCDRARRELSGAGYEDADTGRLRVKNTFAAQRKALAAAHQTATIGLLQATSGPARAKVIEQFLAATKELVQ